MDIKRMFLEESGIDLNDKQIWQFERYFDFLVSENAKYNLTAITDREEVYIKHFLDSVMAYDLIPKNAKVLDIGSGGGFPAVPLLIVRNDIALTMLDSVEKKVNFLRMLLQVIELDAEIVRSRAEEYRLREEFDVVTARAVAKLPTLMEYCIPFVRVGGKMLAYKTNDEEELAASKSATKILGGALPVVYSRNYLEYTRTIIEIKKTSKTPIIYPRKGNKPKTDPL